VVVHHIIRARQLNVINIAKVRMAIDWECDTRRSTLLYLRGGGELSTRNVLYIGLGISISISIDIGNDSSLNASIMPKPGQMKISRTFIWLKNSCTGVEVTFC
jgi:hypothetical protein